MAAVRITLDGRVVEAGETETILQAARRAGIYIPALCSHPDLPPAKGRQPAEAVFQGPIRIDNTREESLAGCGLCLVEVSGSEEPLPACLTPVQEGLVVTTDSPALKKLRQDRLRPILAGHPHACLACAQAAGCSRSQCSSNVPEEERCCPQFGDCELQRVVGYLGLPPETPRWEPVRRPVLDAEPLFKRDYTLCLGCTRCVRACQDLRGVGALGWVWDQEGRVQVGTLAPTLAESGCRFCTACVEVCPTGAIMDRNRSGGDKADRLVPCRAACPAGVDVPAYLDHLASGRTEEALLTVRERVPLPGVLGRVCSHPCEAACRRGELNQPLAVCLLKRYAADHGGQGWPERLETLPPTGRKAAVVGAGPAGLSAAFHLARKGHAVTIFEAEEEPGGMLRYGIPAFRLPADILAAEIAQIEALGVEIRTGTRVESLTQLKAQGFEAVFLSLGARLSRRLEIQGAEQDFVLWGLDFLKAVRQGRDPRLGPGVVVIGGGNVALDVALSAFRQGAERVDLVCLESREEMPAHPREIEAAEEEGVAVHNSWGPAGIGPNGTVTFHCCLRVFDDQGRFAPEYDQKRTMDLAADQVIMAIGQASDLSLLEGGAKVAAARGLIQVDEKTLATGEPGVFAGGDVVAGPESVVQAVAAGRKAASSMDAYLGGDGMIDFTLLEPEPPDPCLGRVEGFAGLARLEPARRQAEERKLDYGEICLGYTAQQARAEAGRCLKCHLRLTIAAPPHPPEQVLPLEEGSLELVPPGEGVVVFFDREMSILSICGTAGMRAEVASRLAGGSRAAFFEFEEDPFYSKAESERIQAFLQQHGSMPPGDGSAGGGDDLEDLF